MAGHHWDDWFEREEFIGQISDIRVQNLQVEREVVQKRTFTRWMNLHLEKCDPPLQIQDLFQDIQDGHVLMALLEELSGCKLLHGFKKSSHRIFRLNNIAKVLSFLEERNVKLVSIDAADIADGNSSIILGLIWNIILFFQIKELTGNIRSQFPSSSSLSSIPTSSDSDTSFSSSPSEERQSAAITMRENSKAIKKLLQWIQRRTRKYGVAVQDFGKSWTSGLAFLAVIKSIDSSLVDMRKALLRTPRENLEDAFRIAHYSLGIPRLLEPEDMAINTPDEQSIIMYVSQFLEHFPGIQESEEPSQLIERSVSMGRLNFRDIDSEHMRNGAYQSRVKQRSYMFQRDTTQPPPKVLISSVSEDRCVLEPRSRVTAARSWSSEDILSDSPHAEDESNSGDVNTRESGRDVLQDFGSPQESFTHSPSSVPESMVGDSAINSPDSWMEGELNPDRFSESRSDSSLYDSGTAWDVYRATPVEVTPYDEGFISSIEDRAPDEAIIETCIDERRSSLDRFDMQTEKNQEEEWKEEKENAETLYQNPDSGQTADLRETKHIDETPLQKEDISREQKPLIKLYEGESLDSSASGDLLKKSDQLNRFEPIFSTEPPDDENRAEEIHLREQDGGESHQNGKYNGQSECLEQTSEEDNGGQRTDAAPEDEVEDVRMNSDSLKEGNGNVDGSLKILRDSTQCEESSSTETLDKHSFNGGTAFKPSLNIPLISITSEPDEPDEETELYPGILDQDKHDDQWRNSEVWSSQGLENSVGSNDDVQEPPENPSSLIPKHTKPMRDPESDSARDPIDQDGSFGTNSKGNSDDFLDKQNVSAQHPSTNSDHQPDGYGWNDSDGHWDHPGNHMDSFNGFQNILDPGSQQLNGQIATPFSEPTELSRNLDQFSSDYHRSSPTEDLVGDRIEPMDLFYPDKEESILPEPPDTEMQRWPSVLSVSALEPAPPSDRSEDLLGDDFLRGGEHEHTPSDSSPSQEQCVMCGVTIGAVQAADVSEAGSNEGPLRIDSIRPNETHIAPVLRHRKGARLSESTDKPRAAPRTAEPEDSDLWWKENWELCLLLLLWLLLYSFMVLPQMDLKTLPSLLLNR
ncbi:PREDICTED: calmin [Cyprinodon variegatus]|uniref:Calmin n=1 Tax=Cyprinodon variegatus TaxID=28743 RepID=A0A3Q2DEG6_CYPVA|nr:PREDICTED: calmin [Cyprinodon variegatus]